MLKNITSASETTNALLSLLPTSGTMAGISIGLVGVVHLKVQATITTVADDMLLFSALGFLLACYLIFFALRQVHAGSRPKWVAGIDLLFLASLSLMVFSGFVIVYEFF
jgi:hypothetical protein